MCCYLLLQDGCVIEVVEDDPEARHAQQHLLRQQAAHEHEARMNQQLQDGERLKLAAEKGY